MKQFILKDAKIREAAIKYIHYCNPDVIYEVVIKPYKRNRSLEQNALYWRFVKIIGDEIGYAKEEMHNILADKFLEPVVVEYGGKVITGTRSTKSLKVKEFAEYLTVIGIWASRDLGIHLPATQKD